MSQNQKFKVLLGIAPNRGAPTFGKKGGMYKIKVGHKGALYFIIF